MKQPIKKIKPFSKEWENAANSLARSYCPNIYACKKCHYPVVDGYCCTTCGDSDPYSTEIED